MLLRDPNGSMKAHRERVRTISADDSGYGRLEREAESIVYTLGTNVDYFQGNKSHTRSYHNWNGVSPSNSTYDGPEKCNGAPYIPRCILI